MMEKCVLLAYTFTDLSTSTFDFSVFLKTENYNTPDNFVVPVTARTHYSDGKKHSIVINWILNTIQPELNDHNF